MDLAIIEEKEVSSKQGDPSNNSNSYQMKINNSLS